MANKKLVDYIKFNIDNGESPSLITGKLINVGWSRADIDNAIKHINSNNKKTLPIVNANQSIISSSLFNYKKTLLSIKVDSSTIILFLSNIIVIIVAVTQNWNIFQIMFVYWIQSIIIGIFSFLKIITAKSFFAVLIFFVNYGLFHLIYFRLIASNYNILINSSFIWLSALIFFGNHLFSFIVNYKKKNIKNTFHLANLRVIPMHAILMFSRSSIAGTIGLVFFFTIKIFG